MQLPFTHNQFLDVFAAYNRALWPAAALLWIATVAAVARWLRAPAGQAPAGQATMRPRATGPAAAGPDRREQATVSGGNAGPDRELAALLAVHWAWSGLAYQLAFFREINPAAAGFAALFVVQAVLFAWLGLIRRRLAFDRSPGPRRTVALLLVAYGLAYPALGLLLGLSYPRVPSFGVPCPTAILTAGLLLVVDRRQVWALGVIPLLWTVVGGSAAFLLGVRADLMLVVAGLLLAAALLAPGALRLGPAAAAGAGGPRSL